MRKSFSFLSQKIIQFLPLIFFFTFFSSASGQEMDQPVIGGIEIFVDGWPAPAELKLLLPLHSGKAFSPFLIRKIIQNLYLTGLFSEIKVLQSGENPVDLAFHLERQLYLRQSFYLVTKGLTSDLIEKEVRILRRGEPFDETLLGRARTEIENILRNEGFFEPEIEVRVERIANSNLVDLIWKIDPGSRMLVRQVQWKGEAEKISPEDREEINRLAGKEYNPRLLQVYCQDLQQRFRRQGFPRAEINWLVSVDRDNRAVDVEINAWLYEKIVIEFQGAKVPVELITPLWEERVFEEWALSEGESRLLSYLRRKGYLQAEVRGKYSREENVLKVSYNIRPGRKQFIAAVTFSGQKAFSEEELRQALALPARAFLTAVIDGESVYELPQRLEALYKMRGFPEARVFLRLESKGKRALAHLFIEEGPQEKIGSIQFEPDLIFPGEVLIRIIGLKPGDPYYSPQIKLICQKIVDYYEQNGFRGTSVRVREIESRPGIYNLIYEVKEGERYRVRQIIFIGALITRQATIKKELRIKEGDWAAADLIQESKRNLEHLRVFTSVQVEEIPVSENELDLVFRFYEGERSLASVGIGLETKSEPRSFEIWNNVLRLRGTAEIVRSNLMGDASQLSFVSQMSLKETRGVVSWEQPYFFGLPLRGYLNLWLEREERISFGFDRRGVSLTGIRPVKGDLMTILTLRYARTVLTHLEITESEIDRQFFPFSSTSLSTSLIHDRRNDSFNPENGYFASAVFEWAFPLFGSEADFLKAFIKYQRFYSPAMRWNLSGTFRLGLGRGRMPIHERFFAGGSNSFRGQEFDELGPRDPFSLKPVGGKALILFNFELSFPFLSSLPAMRGVVFYDTGNVFSKRSQFDLASLEHALGLGLRYRTPLGPLRLELAWNLTERKTKPLLFITIGQIF